MKKIYALIILTILAVGCKKESMDYKFDQSTLRIKVGERVQLHIKKGDITHSIEGFIYRSSNVEVAPINGSCQVNGLKKGTVTLTAEDPKSSVVIAKCEVTVTD